MSKLSDEQKAKMREGRRRRRESGEPSENAKPSYVHSVKSRAMRELCLECMVGQRKEIEICTALACPLYPFRLGENPFAGRSVKAYIDDLKRRREEKAKRIDCRKESVYGLGSEDETDDVSNESDDDA